MHLCWNRLATPAVSGIMKGDCFRAGSGKGIDMPSFAIRQANGDDISLIHTFILELAQYERMADRVVATEETLRDWLVVKRIAEVLIGEEDGAPVGYALFFHNFSTFEGRAGIYLEDIYVRPAARGRGYGRAFFRRIAQLCEQRGCPRLEWSCLDWNAPSIGFYKAMGAIPLDEWTVYRLTGEKLRALAYEDAP